MRPTSFLLKTNAHPNPSNAAGDPCAAWAQAAGMASTRHRPNHAPRSEPNRASLALRQPTGFFQSCVSALRASRTLLYTATRAFDPGSGCSSPPGIEPSALTQPSGNRSKTRQYRTQAALRSALVYLILPLWGGGVRWLIGRYPKRNSRKAKQPTRSVVRSAVDRLTVV